MDVKSSFPHILIIFWIITVFKYKLLHSGLKMWKYKISEERQGSWF